MQTNTLITRKRDMSDLKQYIFPRYNERETIGQGVIADGYFITSAHEVQGNPSCYVVLMGKQLELSKENLFLSEVVTSEYKY